MIVLHLIVLILENIWYLRIQPSVMSLQIVAVIFNVKHVFKALRRLSSNLPFRPRASKTN